MTHLTEDTLLKFVLQTLDESESTAVSAHLSECEQCATLQRTLQTQIERLGSVDLQIEIPPPPRVRRQARQFLSAWKWAAVLAVGFLLGFATAQLSDSRHPIPVPQRLIPVRMPTPSGYVPCPASDLRTVREW